MIEFFVHGKPAPAGSKTGYYNPKSERVIMAPASKNTAPWMQLVKWAAIQEGFSKGRMLLDGPVHLTITFIFNRPKKHYRTGKYSGLLKPSAPTRKTTMPDLTKLVRAAEDALTGLVWRDDSQVVGQSVSKIWASDSEGQNSSQGARIIIEEL